MIVGEEKTASDLRAGSWLESLRPTAVNAMTQRTSQQLMPLMKSDSPPQAWRQQPWWGGGGVFVCACNEMNGISIMTGLQD